MAKMYRNNKLNMTVMTGKVDKVNDDRMSFLLKTQDYIKAENKNVEVEILVRSTTPIEEDFVAGQNITCVGYVIPDPQNAEGTTVQAMYLSNKSQSWDYKTLSVVNGEVVFARYVEEKNEDGTPKMTKPYTDKDGNVKPAKAKSPHFDIGIQTYEADEAGGRRRVLHTIREYGFKGDQTKIERLKARFKNFDRENNPCYATVVTQPGQEYSSVNVRDDKEYTNFYCSHMGVSSLDIVYTKERVKEQSAPTTPAPAPAAPAPAPAPTPSGLDSGSPLENDLEDEMFMN